MRHTLSPRHPVLLRSTATHCNTLRHTATHCNTLQHTGTHCNTLQHTATHCNTLWVFATLQNDTAQKWRTLFPGHSPYISHYFGALLRKIIHDNKASYEFSPPWKMTHHKSGALSYYNGLQHTATHCNTLQHTMGQTVNLRHPAE